MGMRTARVGASRARGRGQAAGRPDDVIRRVAGVLFLPLLLAAALVSAGAVRAQEDPFIREQQRLQERERALREQLERTPDVRLPAGDAPADAAATP